MAITFSDNPVTSTPSILDGLGPGIEFFTRHDDRLKDLSEGSKGNEGKAQGEKQAKEQDRAISQDQNFRKKQSETLVEDSKKPTEMQEDVLESLNNISDSGGAVSDGLKEMLYRDFVDRKVDEKKEKLEKEDDDKKFKARTNQLDKLKGAIEEGGSKKAQSEREKLKDQADEKQERILEVEELKDQVAKEQEKLAEQGLTNSDELRALNFQLKNTRIEDLKADIEIEKSRLEKRGEKGSDELRALTLALKGTEREGQSDLNKFLERGLTGNVDIVKDKVQDFTINATDALQVAAKNSVSNLAHTKDFFKSKNLSDTPGAVQDQSSLPVDDAPLAVEVVQSGLSEAPALAENMELAGSSIASTTQELVQQRASEANTPSTASPVGSNVASLTHGGLGVATAAQASEPVDSEPEVNQRAEKLKVLKDREFKREQNDELQDSAEKIGEQQSSLLSSQVDLLLTAEKTDKTHTKLLKEIKEAINGLELGGPGNNRNGPDVDISPEEQAKRDKEDADTEKRKKQDAKDQKKINKMEPGVERDKAQAKHDRGVDLRSQREQTRQTNRKTGDAARRENRKRRQARTGGRNRKTSKLGFVNNAWDATKNLASDAVGHVSRNKGSYLAGGTIAAGSMFMGSGGNPDIGKSQAAEAAYAAQSAEDAIDAAKLAKSAPGTVAAHAPGILTKAGAKAGAAVDGVKNLGAKVKSKFPGAKPVPTKSSIAGDIKLPTSIKPPVPVKPSTMSKVSKTAGAVAGGAMSAGKGAVAKVAKTALIKKIITSSALKMVAKKVPFLSLAVGAGLGLDRALAGDFSGAFLELTSGVAGTATLIPFAPGVGTAVSFGLDGTLLAKDLHESGAFDNLPEATSWVSENTDMVMQAMVDAKNQVETSAEGFWDFITQSDDEKAKTASLVDAGAPIDTGKMVDNLVKQKTLADFQVKPDFPDDPEDVQEAKEESDMLLKAYQLEQSGLAKGTLKEGQLQQPGLAIDTPDSEVANIHADKPWGKFYKPRKNRDPATQKKLNRAGVRNAKMKYRASQAGFEDSSLVQRPDDAGVVKGGDLDGKTYKDYYKNPKFNDIKERKKARKIALKKFKYAQAKDAGLTGQKVKYDKYGVLLPGQKRIDTGISSAYGIDLSDKIKEAKTKNEAYLKRGAESKPTFEAMLAKDTEMQAKIKDGTATITGGIHNGKTVDDFYHAPDVESPLAKATNRKFAEDQFREASLAASGFKGAEIQDGVLQKPKVEAIAKPRDPNRKSLDDFYDPKAWMGDKRLALKSARMKYGEYLKNKNSGQDTGGFKPSMAITNAKTEAIPSEKMDAARAAVQAQFKSENATGLYYTTDDRKRLTQERMAKALNDPKALAKYTKKTDIAKSFQTSGLVSSPETGPGSEADAVQEATLRAESEISKGTTAPDVIKTLSKEYSDTVVEKALIQLGVSPSIAKARVSTAKLPQSEPIFSETKAKSATVTKTAKVGGGGIEHESAVDSMAQMRKAIDNLTALIAANQKPKVEQKSTAPHSTRVNNIQLSNVPMHIDDLGLVMINTGVV